MANRRPPPTCDPSKKPLPPGFVGARVTIHVNLQNGCFSVGVKDELQGYVHGLRLGGVTTRVRPAGHMACKLEESRNVHAFMDGKLLEIVDATPPLPEPPAGWRAVGYNCLTGPACFFYRDTALCADRILNAGWAGRTERTLASLRAGCAEVDAATFERVARALVASGALISTGGRGEHETFQRGEVRDPADAALHLECMVAAREILALPGARLWASRDALAPATFAEAAKALGLRRAAHA